MFGPKRIYNQQLNFDRESIVQRFLKSKKFIECVAEPYVNAFRQSQKDELFINRLDTYSFRISENCGFGGILEVIGTVDILEINQTKSTLKIKLQLGIFPANFPQFTIMILLLIGLLLIPLTPAILLGISFICFFPAIGWLIHYFKVKIFLKILSNAIEIENNWK